MDGDHRGCQAAQKSTPQYKGYFDHCAFATLANADIWEQIADFALWNEEYLRQYIELKNGVPSHDTIQRVMGMIRPESLQQLQRKWQELLDSNEGEKLKKIICVDGKTMRSNKREGTKPCHIVSAWSREDGYCLGQKAVEEKSNEITAIPKVLESIEIKGQVVTIDAMGTQTAIAETIRKRRADYVPAVKENHAKVGLCLQFVASPMVTLFHNLHRFHKIVSFDIGRDDSNFLYNHIS